MSTMKVLWIKNLEKNFEPSNKIPDKDKTHPILNSEKASIIRVRAELIFTLLLFKSDPSSPLFDVREKGHKKVSIP